MSDTDEPTLTDALRAVTERQRVVVEANGALTDQDFGDGMTHETRERSLAILRGLFSGTDVPSDDVLDVVTESVPMIVSHLMSSQNPLGVAIGSVVNGLLVGLELSRQREQHHGRDRRALTDPVLWAAVQARVELRLEDLNDEDRARAMNPVVMVNLFREALTSALEDVR